MRSTVATELLTLRCAFLFVRRFQLYPPPFVLCSLTVNVKHQHPSTVGFGVGRNTFHLPPFGFTVTIVNISYNCYFGEKKKSNATHYIVVVVISSNSLLRAFTCSKPDLPGHQADVHNGELG